MKRLAILFTVLVFLLSGCVAKPEAEKEDMGENSGIAESGIWISFSEINGMLLSEKGFLRELEEVVENCKEMKIGNVYIHIRSYCDSLFASDYFPLIDEAKRYDYDVFEAMLNAFHDVGIKVHAWINPYRVLTSSSDINAVSSDSPAYKWLKDEDTDNDVNVCFWEGIYLNPAEAQVQRLVIDGIREVLERYDVDGIHFDDYFYPTAEEEFDSVSYKRYMDESDNPMSLGDWRRANVNALISGCYSAIKNIDSEVLFTISPAASIENNYNALYADVSEWVYGGYVDRIIPQLYFGFEYPAEEYRFESLLDDWKRLIRRNRDVELHIGLASYKIGTQTEPDNEEWQRDDDIIAKQAEMCYEDDDVSGYVLFSYSSFFAEDDLNSRQRENYMEFAEQKAE